MPRYHILFDYAIGTFGANDSYVTNDVSGTQAAGLIQSLINARGDLMPESVAMTGVQISNLDLVRASRYFKPGSYKWPTKSGGTLIIPAHGKWVITDPGDDLTQLKVCLQVIVAYGTAGRQISKYIAGVPISALAPPPANLNRLKPVIWWRNVEEYTTLLASGDFAVRARTQTGAFGPKEVLGVALAAPTVGPDVLIVANNALPDLKLGERVSLSKVKLKAQFGGTVNANWKVSAINKSLSADTWGIQLEGFPLLDPGAFKTYGFLQRFDYSYQTINDAFVEDLTTHDRGGPLPRHRGKRKTRTLLQS